MKIDSSKYKVLLFDLDGTLLTNDKKISKKTYDTVIKCREKGYKIGVCTARGLKIAEKLLADLNPEIMILSIGAVVYYSDELIYKDSFSVEETNNFIKACREIAGADCEITVDSLDEHYWYYLKYDEHLHKNSTYTDFENFNEEALKITVEIHDEIAANKLISAFPEIDSLKFVDGNWYKFSKKNITKEYAIKKLCEITNIKEEEIVAFGDDVADLEMLKMCGLGVAMGNGIESVKNASDIVIGTNNEDGIAAFLNEHFLNEN